MLDNNRLQPTIISGVWNESWANGPGKETLRTAAIKEGAARSDALNPALKHKDKQ